MNNEAIYSYDFDLGITIVTDTRKRTSVYEFEAGGLTRITDSDSGVTGYTYDEYYNRVSTTDVRNNATAWVSDRYSNCLELTDAQMHKTTMAYHPDFHRITKITDNNEREWSYKYNPTGDMIEKIIPKPEGEETAHTYYGYDLYGNLTKITDPEGIITEYGYDDYGDVTKITDGEGNYVQYDYDALSRLVSSRYGEGPATTYEYDGLSRLKKKTYPDNSYEEYTYDNNGNLLTFRDANGHITTYAYNDLNQRVSQTDAENNTVQFSHDSFGNLTEIKRTVDSRELITRLEYDDHYSRLTKITDAEGVITEFTYEDSPPILRSTDYTKIIRYKDANPLIVQTRDYDPCCRLTGITDGLNYTTSYGYDEIGNLLTLTDAAMQTTTFGYTATNSVLSTSGPGATAQSTYLDNSKLQTKTDGNGNTIIYEYDLSGRLKKITYPDTSTVEYRYNQYGKVSQMTDSRGITVYGYNDRGWLIQMDGPEANDTVSCTYDYVGNRLTMTVSGEGTYNYTYYDNNLPHTITNPQVQTTTFSYDTANRCKSMEYANGTKTEWSYFDNDNVKNLTVRNSSLQILSSYAYEYNSLNQLEKITDKDNNTYNYVYDDAGQLTHEDKKDASNVSIYYRDYVYDEVGNRIEETRDGVSIDYNYNLNRLTSRVTPSETINYQYDNNGNLITETSSVGGTKTYSYDYENRLLQAASPTLTGTGMLQAAYAYSGDGVRISVDNNGTVVKYIYDGMVPVVEKDASGLTIAAYTKIPEAPGGIGGLVSSTDGTNTIYYHCSHLGNVTLVTDAGGNVVKQYDYDAFGNIISQSGSLENEYKYKSKEYSANTGLVYFGARYYDPLLGRFISVDPLGMVDGANLYLYCGNDPVNMVDAWGDRTYTWPYSWKGWIGVILTGTGSVVIFIPGGQTIGIALFVAGSTFSIWDLIEGINDAFDTGKELGKIMSHECDEDWQDIYKQYEDMNVKKGGP